MIAWSKLQHQTYLYLFLVFFVLLKMTHGYLVKICGIRVKTPIFAIQL